MKNTFFFILLLLGSTTNTSFAQSTIIRQTHFNIQKNKLALEGYDPISYFEGNPLKGSDAFTVNHNGVVYKFTTNEHKNKFTNSPATFEPAYGGWCAFAMADKAEKVTVNPTTYKIINGKLYLFYNAYFKNTLNNWNKNEKNLLLLANKNWGVLFK